MNNDEIKKEIDRLKKENNAIIIAHNYQTLDVQEIADFIGDSLKMTEYALNSNACMIIFAGVKFMAEMASAVRPSADVYIPDTDANCPMAAFCSSDKVREKKKQYKDTPVVLYVNTTSQTKMECDYICTSSNAIDMVNNIDSDIILFGPDKNLADYIRSKTDKIIIDIEPNGHCYVHNQFDISQILLLKEEYPDAVIVVHPECPIEVQEYADIICSTSKMLDVIKNNGAGTFIIATEIGLIERAQKLYPDKLILPAYEHAICRQMKKTTVEKILHILRNKPEENIVRLDDKTTHRIREIIKV